MTRTTKATTSSRWIMPPATCRLKPSSHRTRSTTKTVQSISISLLQGCHRSAGGTKTESAFAAPFFYNVRFLPTQGSLPFRAGVLAGLRTPVENESKPHRLCPEAARFRCAHEQPDHHNKEKLPRPP